MNLARIDPGGNAARLGPAKKRERGGKQTREIGLVFPPMKCVRVCKMERQMGEASGSTCNR
jgi:hypothetical protein